ncbi:MAG TPA: hypothetical protein VEQ58_17930 [Polyangiaceae bacterium]|nr:hypothetical protein [Polyangiaceae bacterium]
MQSTLSQAIRAARVASGLTQEQLGRSVGLAGRAVYRWECDHSAPRRRHRRGLVNAISAANPAAAAALAAAFANDTKQARRAAAAAAQLAALPAAPPPVDTRLVLQLAVFALADELDVPPRRLRGALVKLLARLLDAGIALDTAQQLLREWNEAVPHA